jgi:ankyrin repeat protein
MRRNIGLSLLAGGRWLPVIAFVAAFAAITFAATADLRLVKALETNDVAAARTLLKQKADPNTADVDGTTPLQWAAHWNDLDTVRLLIAAGARAHVANRYGVTPLHEACTVGNAAIVNALIKAGADVNAAYGEGETPLMTAARAGSSDVVRLLLESGAQVNAAESFRGETALMMAAVENHADVVKALIAAGADANAHTVEYTFQKLVGGAGGIIHDRPQGKLTPLILAARQGAIESAGVLIDAGADVNATEPQYGFTAMQTALFNGHYALAKMLIEKGADVNDGSLYVTMEMRNLAHYTNRPNPADVERGVSHLDVLSLLLAGGADPNRPYTKTIPPRQAQGNINVPAGATPLYRAVRGIDLTAVKRLLDAGANPSLAIGDGSTPLMAAAGLGAPRGGDEEVTEAANRAEPVDVIRLLIEKGADVGAQNDLGMTAMHYAVQRGSEKTIEFLAKSGGRFDVYNYSGQSAADLARGRTQQVVAKLSAQQ